MARGKDGETMKAKVERGGVADEAKAKAIELAVSSIEKQFGKGAITRMTDDAADHEIACFSSGAPSLDIALGIGGYPRGRVVEIYGPESSGKTTLTLHAIAEIQKRGIAPKLGGATPHATIYAAMITEIAKKGADSRFVRGAEKGTFAHA